MQFDSSDAAAWLSAMTPGIAPARPTTPSRNPLFAVLQSDPLIPLESSSPPTPPPSATTPPPPDLVSHVSSVDVTKAVESNAHPPLSLAQESVSIKKSLEDAIKARNGLAMDYSCQPCSPSSLLTVITDTPNLTILHYSGHGTDTFLTLENDDGSTVPVEREGLSSVLAKRRGGSLKLVFVSACQSSSIATCFVSAGIPHVIAVDSNTFILDNIARTFAETFYSSLIAGGSVESAYEVARDRSMLENRHSETNVGEDVTKQFLLLGEGDHSEVMFPAEEEERAGPVEFRDISPPLLPSSVPPPNSNTVNHRTTIHKVYSKIVSALTVVDSPRLISLTGQAGIGKTQIALFALRYLRERAHRFNLAAVYNADLLGHVGGSGRRRKHRCKETFEDIIRSAINPRATSFAQAVSEVTQRSVILIDGCDVWLSSSTFRFGNAVANLVKICPLLVVVATGRNGLFEKLVDVGEGWGGPNSQRISQRCYCQETVIRIPPLSNYHAATLLTHRCPRNFDASEMYGGLFVDFDEGNALQALSENSIVKAIGGLPETIEEVAAQLVDLNLVADSNKILNLVIPKAKSRGRCMAAWKSACGKIGIEWGKWSDVGYWLARDFDEVRLLRGRKGKRRLSVKCLEIMSAKFAIHGSSNGYIEESKFFGELWTWWGGIVGAVARCGDLWDVVLRLPDAAGTIRRPSGLSHNPYGGNDENFYLQAVPDEYAIMGFVERDEALRLLGGKKVGTFLIRFSNEAGCLAITWVRVAGASVSGAGGTGGGEITSVLLKPSRKSYGGWEVNGVYYETLGKLIMSIDELKLVYPNVLKEDVFK
ncbi:hypothetical protein TrST_g13005 [Triparma strigata]|nr:hypothetical protein TrST_g13005 [Triparma strigata]